jgi:T-complex protein 1 subunit eta
LRQLLDIVHPAAKTLVDIAKSQDSEVGDGTTTVTLLAGEFLRESKQFIEDGVHPQNIIRSFRQAAELAVAHVKTQVTSSSEGSCAHRSWRSSRRKLDIWVSRWVMGPGESSAGC